MIDTAVVNQEGAEVGTFSFDESTLGGAVKKRLMKQAVVMYLANRRQGTASTRRSSEVAGSGKKLWRQKGTGRARIGTRRAVQRRGGGSMFGPKPRDFRKALPRKARRAAMRSALLSKFADGEVVVIESLSLPEVKTRAVAALLKTLGVDGGSCLLVTPDHESSRDVVRAGRNIPTLTIMPGSDLNAYDILRHKRLVMTRQTAEALTQPVQTNEG